jgi:hypothetical protein
MSIQCARWHSSATLTWGFPCFFLSCKANARVKCVSNECKCVLYHSHRVSTQLQLTNISHHISHQNPQRRGTARTLPKFLCCSMYCLFLCRSVYCLCINVYWTTATQWLPNCGLTSVYHISYQNPQRWGTTRTKLPIFLCCSMCCLFCVVLCTVCV